MQIRFRCSKCRTPLETEAHASGTNAECPHCSTVLTVPAPVVGPGTSLGGFRIERLIGEGGMGQVFLARQLSMDRDVALKVMRMGPHLTREDAERFLKEVRLLARLDHPNIVTAHEAGEDDGVLFLAMNFVRGDPLDRKLARDGAMPEKQALTIVRQVAAALDYAWTEHRLLHRDLKPANILLDLHGEPKLADLGLAHSLMREGEPPPDIAGTPNYMSPEQAAGRADIDFRSDIYSLGATLYHMLTGRLPFAAVTPEETIALKSTAPLPDPRTYQPSLSDQTVALMAGMLANDPGERFSSWAELRSEVERALGGTAKHKIVVPAGHAGHLHPHPAPRKAASWVAPVVIFAVVGAAAVALVAGLRLLKPQASGNISTPGDSPSSVVAPTDVERAAEEKARKISEQEAPWVARLAEVDAYAKDHAGEHDEILKRYGELKIVVAGSSLSPLLDARLATWKAARAAAVDAAWREWEARARDMAKNGDPEGAAKMLESYEGPYAKEWTSALAALAEGIRAQARAAWEENRKQDEEMWKTARAEIACDVLQNNLSDAARVLKETCASARVPGASGEADQWKTLLDRLVGFDAWLLSSYQSDVGSSTEITTPQGRESWIVAGVNDGCIRVRRNFGGAVGERVIRMAELGLDERYRRLDRETSLPLRNQARAWLLALANRIHLVPQILQDATDPVGIALREQAQKLQKVVASAAADRVLSAMVQRATGGAGSESTPALVSRIRRSRVQPHEAQYLRSMVGDFRAQYPEAAAVDQNKPLLSALEHCAPYPREVEPGVLQQALQKLEAANPGFNAHSAMVVEGDDGLELVITGRAVATIAALESLPLVKLSVAGTSVKDLSPLRSMPLVSLDVSDTGVKDFFPLRALPLKELKANNCGLDSVASLRGFLLESLSISTNAVASLSPLQGMPLKKLVARKTAFNSLAPLSRMPLESLDLSYSTGTPDLRPLKDTPLKELSLSHTDISDLSGLKGVPLEALNVSWCYRLKSLQSLPETLPLKKLWMEGAYTSSLELPRGLTTIEQLWIGGRRELRDLKGLIGMNLKVLGVDSTEVSDLSPLKGMPLETLSIRETRVRDLRPLLECTNLETLIFPNRDANLAPLRNHPSLKKIGEDWGRTKPLADWFPEKEKPAH